MAKRFRCPGGLGVSILIRGTRLQFYWRIVTKITDLKYGYGLSIDIRGNLACSSNVLRMVFYCVWINLFLFTQHRTTFDANYQRYQWWMWCVHRASEVIRVTNSCIKVTYQEWLPELSEKRVLGKTKKYQSMQTFIHDTIILNEQGLLYNFQYSVLGGTAWRVALENR